jgi:hypothetical protein
MSLYGCSKCQLLVGSPHEHGFVPSRLQIATLQPRGACIGPELRCSPQRRHDELAHLSANARVTRAQPRTISRRDELR